MSLSDKYLIVTADDFGRNLEDDLEIIKAYQSGIVTGVSVFTTRNRLLEARSLLKETPGLLTGVHLDMVNFDLRMANPSSKELKKIFESQIEDFLSAGFKLSHIDNHRPEIYFKPKLFEASMELASKFNVRIRTPFNRGFKDEVLKLSLTYGVSVDVLNSLDEATQKIQQKNGVQHTDYFQVLDDSLRSSESLTKWISQLRPGVTELCTHPGESSSKALEEATLLKSPEIRSALDQFGVKLLKA